MAKRDVLEEVLWRLDVLIALHLDRSAAGQEVCVADRIERLSKLKVRSSQIGAIIGKSGNYVTATLSKRKKAAKRKAKPNE